MPDQWAARPVAVRRLFSPPNAEFVKMLHAYGNVLREAHPLRARHRTALPMDVKRLSEALTSERGPGPRANYLAAPANLSAYLSYFLPWNLHRLGLLLAGLSLDLPDGARVLDLGAGPLTLAQALWMARPDLRTRRLAFVCLDQTGSVLRAGRTLFDALAGEAGRNWSFDLVQAPLFRAPAGPFALAAAVNCVNEFGRGRGEEGRHGLERLAELLAERLEPGGRLLVVEPGTRLGGKLVGRLREELLELGLAAHAPCTHDAPCPMLAPRWRSWCHFTAPPLGAPDWLGKLSRAAGLPKERLSLSFLLMGTDNPGHDPRDVRVVSSCFALPEGGGAYGCCRRGLALLTFARRPADLDSGALARLPAEPEGERDPKTGAILVSLDGGARRAQSAPSDPADAGRDRPERGEAGPARPGVEASRPHPAGGDPRSAPRPAGQNADRRPPAASRPASAGRTGGSDARKGGPASEKAAGARRAKPSQPRRDGRRNGGRG